MVNRHKNKQLIALALLRHRKVKAKLQELEDQRADFLKIIEVILVEMELADNLYRLCQQAHMKISKPMPSV